MGKTINELGAAGAITGTELLEIWQGADPSVKAALSALLAVLGSTGGVDNAALRSDGTGGLKFQASDLGVADVAAGALILSSIGGNLFVIPATIRLGSNVRLETPADGELDLRNSADSDYALLRAGIIAAFTSGNSNKVALRPANGVTLASDMDVLWSNGSAENDTKDIGLERAAAGILKVNNGSSGSGTLQFGTFNALGAEVGAGTITIKDGGGTDRKLLVVA